MLVRQAGRAAGTLTVTALLAGNAAAQRPTAPEWPQWRGPGGQAHAETAAPLRWGTDENILWKAPVEGRGHSSPIVVDDLIFLTSATSGEKVPGAGAIIHFLGSEEFLHPDSLGADQRLDVLLFAVDRHSGALRWRREVRAGALPYDNRHRIGSYANPTPVSDGRRVVTWFGTQGLYAFSLEGDLLWSQDFGGVGTLGMGVATSPVLIAATGLVVVQSDVEEGDGSFVAALDIATGAIRWRAERTQRVGWATPAVVQSAGGGPSLVIAMGTDEIVAYGADSGEERWRVEGLGGNAVPSPVTSGDGLVFAVTGYPRKNILALDLEDGSLRWDYRKGQGYVPSPIFHRGTLYLVSDGGILTALSGGTGEVIYEGGRMPLPSRFFSSPVVAGERIYLTSEDGDTHVIRPGPQFEILATNSLDEPVMASPAVVDGTIYLRGAEHLYAIADRTPTAGNEP
ncbi:MAG: PQQ-binding-like beta-propeller repeat protein [Acidobacteriota bacterium]|nr:PQQ-binding-like beta-propeller repeat protein [Acidobacteriota bacterium]